ncbi:hypothetical protein [Microbulbifer sp. S227A]|uniref:hypothetical protein n=1 Tax=Microbulbifer sp. S227A TaxID=3415131 RepID=UPI003C7D4A26
MTHTADCLDRRSATPSRIWISLLLIAAVIGFVASNRAGNGTFLSGLNAGSGIIPGEDWHGNVRRSVPAH